MAVTIDDTVSGASANSYVTLDYADSYFEPNSHWFTIWDALSDNEKSALLVRAAQSLDSMNFLECKYDVDQSMEFPRNENGLPDRVKKAQCEIAILLYYQSDSDTGGKAAIEQETEEVEIYQAIKVKFKSSKIENDSIQKICGGSIERIDSLLAPYLSGTNFEWSL